MLLPCFERVIAIDPDIDKSGIAACTLSADDKGRAIFLHEHDTFAERKTKFAPFDEIGTLGFFDLIDYIRTSYQQALSLASMQRMTCQKQDVAHFKFTVVIEAGWLNKVSSYHKAGNIHIGQAIANKVGKNQMIGLLLEQYVKERLQSDYGVECVLHKPTTTKLNAMQFKALTGCDVRTNQDSRDAAAIAYKYALRSKSEISSFINKHKNL